jgi:hypothetical protein
MVKSTENNCLKTASEVSSGDSAKYTQFPDGSAKTFFLRFDAREKPLSDLLDRDVGVLLERLPENIPLARG